MPWNMKTTSTPKLAMPYSPITKHPRAPSSDVIVRDGWPKRLNPQC
jgi:hypothetical protein